MPLYREVLNPCPVALPRPDLRRMVRLVGHLYHLSRCPAYRSRVLPLVPEAGRFDPGHDSVMMGYDFHLTADGPRLIEVNTNAGGALLAYLAHHPSISMAREALSERLKTRFLEPFAEEIRRFSHGSIDRPRHIVILDEKPEDQYLFEEMKLFQQLFREWGVRCTIADPSEIEAGAEGVFLDGDAVDLIYNRHCDFYLQLSEMAGIRAAYLAGKICLTPNPFAYALLADKRRMILWSEPEFLSEIGFSSRAVQKVLPLIPRTRPLSSVDREEAWAARRDLVFKPAELFGSRGVLVGTKISRTRFDGLDTQSTLVQELVPPSLNTPCDDQEPMKTDFRLYAYRSRILGVAARLYRGQVTNLRTAGGGFAPVKIVE